MRLVIAFTLLITFFSGNYALAQCCAAGSGSPIAGGHSQGVLQEHQVEFSASYQYTTTSKVYGGDSVDAYLLNVLNEYSSQYGYLRAAYGITSNLSLSVESGYFFNKTQIAQDFADTMISQGIGDLIIFPRYDVLNRTDAEKRTEITLGLGWKIPIGKYDDSTKYIEPFSGNPYYIRMPPAVQPTNGSNDFIFYAFFFRGYPLKNFQVFSNVLYIKKGWNPLGEKSGDYASMSLFAGKTLFKKLGLTLQVRGEYIAKATLNEQLFLNGYYNYDTETTGSQKIFFIPQISYSMKPFTFFLLTEIPLYQHMNVTPYTAQIGSQYSVTAGISYRFFPFGGPLKDVPDIKSSSDK